MNHRDGGRGERGGRGGGFGGGRGDRDRLGGRGGRGGRGGMMFLGRDKVSREALAYRHSGEGGDCTQLFTFSLFFFLPSFFPDAMRCGGHHRAKKKKGRGLFPSIFHRLGE